MSSSGAGLFAAALQEHWDVIVVGTGMGGATIGHRLAQAGKRVLFCELGGAPPGDQALRGGYPEMAADHRGAVLAAADKAGLIRAGRYADTLHDVEGGRDFVPFIGCGPGGSSALYGMALERFMPEDFDPGAGWPLRYDELAPFYAAAEALYRVRGDVDSIAAARIGPLPPPALMRPPPLSAAGAELASYFSARGLHPYRLPAACEQLAGCATCQGYLCAQECKNDAESVCLRPALQDLGAVLLTGCRVLALRVAGRRVTGVRCVCAGQELELRAGCVVLAAGALQSPGILLRSQDGAGGQGLGNRSGLVGRNLMRHLIDLYLVRPRGMNSAAFDPRRKEIACNDFYGSGDTKLGTLQSFGALPPAEMLFGSLRDDVQASRWAWAAPVLGLARPILNPVLRDVSNRWITLATITEDLPDAANAIEPTADPARLTLRYRPTAESLGRAERFRQKMAGVLSGRSWRRLAQSGNNQRIAHVCGTCRFGDNPNTSVLDRDCRVHDLDNAYVVDSSWFASSGGTNPSLTIAANALRVGQRLLSALR